MPKKKQSKKKEPVEKQISAAERKIKFFFKNLPTEKKRFIAPAIHQLATTQILLERLNSEIENGEVIELFKQGSQELRRENPAIKSYNTTLKSYTALFKQLLDLLPNDAAQKAGEELIEFLNKAKK